MTSPTPINGEDTRFSFDYHSHEGFPSILWEVLPYTPLYKVQLYEEHRVPRFRVWLTLEAHPLQPGWRSLDYRVQGGRHHRGRSTEDPNNLLWVSSLGDGNAPTRTLSCREEG
jgi:hypothetical protein